MPRTVILLLLALSLLAPGVAAAHPCEATVKELAGEVTRLENLVAADREVVFPRTARKKRPRNPPYVNDAMLSASSTTAKETVRPKPGLSRAGPKRTCSEGLKRPLPPE